MITPEFSKNSPITLLGISAQAKQLGGYQEKLANSFNLSGMRTLSNSFSNFALQLETKSHAFTSKLERNDFKLIIEHQLRQMPNNYVQLMISEQFNLIEISLMNNFGTIEVLPRDLIMAILESVNSGQSVDVLLLDAFSMVMEKASELVDAYLDEPHLSEHGHMLERSIEAMNDGHYEAGQTLSTALWDTFLCERADRKDPIKEAKKVGLKPNIDSMESFSPLYDYGAYGPALSAYMTPENSSRYSRNGTIHHLSKTSANKLNSLKALTIATGVLGRVWKQSPLTRDLEQADQ